MADQRLFELLAQSLARPSQASRDFQAFADAGNETANSFKKFGDEEQGAQKVSDLLGGGPDRQKRYGNLRLRDTTKKEGLVDLLKQEEDNASTPSVSPHYDNSGNVTGYDNLPPLTKHTKVIQPQTLNLYRGKEFDRNVGNDDITHTQAAYDRAKKDLEEAAPSGIDVGLNPGAADSAKRRMSAAARHLKASGVDGYVDPFETPTNTPPPQNPNARPAPNPVAQGGQPVAGADKVGEFIKKSNIRDTPANREWAKKKIGG